ncbi:cysteine proteinase, partial [Cutaneotrichosporon oleaginosum]
VKRWTKKAEIFNKKFIVIPVNESYHWYLAVIYNPRATLDRARAARFRHYRQLQASLLDLGVLTIRTWIITFDSMGSRHPSVATNLQRWLQCEAKDKLGEDADFASVPYLEGKCLEQPNFYDCGLYLIHFAKQLLRNSEEVLRFI